MPIPSYSPPDVLLNQELDQAVEVQVPRMAACVVAPKYRLSRKGKEAVESFAYDVEGQTIAFTYKEGAEFEAKPAGEEVDHSFTKLNVEGARLELATFTTGEGGDNSIYLDSLEDPNTIRISEMGPGFLEASLGTTTTKLRGRVPKAGDRVLLSDSISSGSRVRSVVRLKGATLSATTGVNSDKDDDLFAAGAYNPRQTSAGVVTRTKPSGWADDVTKVSGTFRQLVEAGANFEGDYADLITVVVKTDTTKATVTSASGAWNDSDVDIEAGSSGSENQLTLTNGESDNYVISLGEGTLVAGYTFRFKISGAYTPLDLADGDINKSGTYTGSKDTTYVLTVISGSPTNNTSTGATVRVYDTAGADVPQEDIEVVANTFFDLGVRGLSAKFASGVQLRTGDTYYIHAVAARESTVSFNGLVLDGPAVETEAFNDVEEPLTATFFLPYNGRISSTRVGGISQWESTGDGVLTEADLTVDVPERETGYRNVPLLAGYGKLSLDWRSAEPLGDLESFDSEAQVLSKAGAYDLDNPYGYSAMVAYAAAEGQRVYGVNTGGETTADFTAALQKLLSQDTTCFIAGITDSQEIRELIRNHCLSESAPDVKHFRKAYLGINSPGPYLLSSEYESEPLSATVTSYGSGNLKATITNSGFEFSDLEFGKDDLIVFPGIIASFKVASILSPTEAILQSGPLAPISPTTVCELWKGDYPAAVEAYLIDKSNNLTNRRATLIWQESGFKLTSEGVKIVPNKYVAAWAAGRRSALPPHVGLTKQPCPLFDGMPAMYNKYSPDSLNNMAAEGLFIIHQKMSGAPIQVRHQLTTDTDKGNLYYEDNITHIVDWLSFQFVDATEPFIGVRNATSKTLADIRAVYTDILALASEELLDSTYGPVIEGFENMSISLAPGTRDTFDFNVDVLVPTPLNRVRITLRGRNGVVTETVPVTV